jgi:DNA-directed RNA polymerase subunit RPC12/RpoP
MRWLSVYTEDEVLNMKDERCQTPPSSFSSCQSCGRKWFYLTDISNGTYSSRCPICGHVLHIFLKKEKLNVKTL